MMKIPVYVIQLCNRGLFLDKQCTCSLHISPTLYPTLLQSDTAHSAAPNHRSHCFKTSPGTSPGTSPLVNKVCLSSSIVSNVMPLVLYTVHHHESIHKSYTIYLCAFLFMIWRKGAGRQQLNDAYSLRYSLLWWPQPSFLPQHNYFALPPLLLLYVCSAAKVFIATICRVYTSVISSIHGHMDRWFMLFHQVKGPRIVIKGLLY